MLETAHRIQTSNNIAAKVQMTTKLLRPVLPDIFTLITIELGLSRWSKLGVSYVLKYVYIPAGQEGL